LLARCRRLPTTRCVALLTVTVLLRS
jgi:hypothetical protein